MRLEDRVTALEKKMEIVLDSVKRLTDNRHKMTVHEAGRKGGEAKVVKGPAALSPERRAEILAAARAAKAAKREAQNDNR